MSGDGAAAWADAVLAAALFAIDPAECQGLVVRARVGPVRERWFALVRELLPLGTPLRRLPLNIADDRLLGGLDLAATLQSGRPLAQSGLLAEADGGVVVIGMAERLAPATVARLARVLDRREVVLERDGLEMRTPTVIGVVALDEGVADDEQPPAALIDRLAFHVDLTGIALRDTADSPYTAGEIAAARQRVAHVCANDEILEGLCGAATALGIGSVRAVLLASKAARAAAALNQRSEVSEIEAALAGRLVLAPRATVLPAPDGAAHAQRGEGSAPPGAMAQRAQSDDEIQNASQSDRRIEDVVLASAEAAIPPRLLAQLQLAENGRLRRSSDGRSGAPSASFRRGRAAGVRRGEPRSGNRLNLIETLRAAAPWQRVRCRNGGVQARDRLPARVEVRREDFRVTRFTRRRQATTIFVVDASGSAALHRLAEAKGAVELLLAECYIRRDRVALLAFRGFGVELLLPPTRSLVRAKRSLASLPGGGGTPLASAIDAAAALADAERRRGEFPAIILLTDGRANVARDGKVGRAPGGEDAAAAARSFRAAGFTALLIDTSPQPQPQAQRLATEMSAVYLPLPYADAAIISGAVRAQGMLPRHREAPPP